MKISSLSLGLKFSIAVTLLIIVSMSSVAVLTINYQKDSLRLRASENSRAMTMNLAHDAVDPILVYDPLRLDELVKTLHDGSGVAYAMIIDSEGKVIAHTDRSQLGTRLSPEVAPEILKSLAGNSESFREYLHENELVREFSHPIAIRSEVLGLAVAAYSVKAMNTAIGERLQNLKKYIFMITALALLAGVAGAFIVSNILTKPLKRLKSKMLEIQTGMLDVEVENRRVVRCWEKLACTKEDCPAYGKLRCWAVAGTFCRGEVQGQFAQKIGDCRQCVVYRESCGDEINELVEVFNQMVRDLRFNLNELEKVNAEKANMERLSALGMMATTVAHETKNPLNAIKIATVYLKNNFRGEILSEFLTIIEEEVTRLNEIATNFLGFSAPAPLKPEPCDVNTIVRSTVELIRQEATDRDIEVILLTDETLPIVMFDFSRMKQALLNLLINALDASGAGDAITVTTEAIDREVTITVQDTGKGMDREEIEHIFKPFYSTKTRGSGLGLAIVDRIVKEHGADIEVDSIPGKGTQFTLRIKALAYAQT